MTKEKIFLRDVFATKILKAEECREYLASIIAAVLDIDKDYVIHNLKLIDTEVSQNIHNKDQEVDVIVENEEMVVNIEINTLNTKQSRIKNNAYIAQLIIRQTYPGKVYKIKPIVQINVDCFDAYLKDEFIYHSVLMEEKYHVKRSDSNIDIYDINLDFLSNLDYNQIRNLSEKDLKWLLYIFVCQDEALKNNLYGGNRMMRKVEKKMEDFMKEFDSLLYYNHDEFREAELEELRQDAYKEGREEGIEHGIKQGIEKGIKKGIEQRVKQNSIETAKKFLLEGIEPSIVAKCSNLTIEDVDKLKEEIEKD